MSQCSRGEETDIAKISRKRGNGEGSVYRRNDDRRWVAQWTVETPNGPKVRYRYGKTQAEAIRKRKEEMKKEANGLVLEADRTTVGEFLDRWIEDSVRGNVSPRTFDNYRSQVRRHIKPALGSVKLVKLGAARVQALYRSKLDEGLSPASVRYVHAVLSRALKQAYRWKLVTRNVADDVDPPVPQGKEARPLSPREARTLLQEARGDRLEALYALAVTLGLRQGELLGLRWDDVDLDARKLRVKHQLQRARDGSGLKLVPTKTRKGRSIKLGVSDVSVLEAHRGRQAEEKRRSCGLYEDRNLVFATQIGTPLDASNVVRRSFKPLLRAAGLPDIRFHDLRHTCATLLFGKGLHPKIVQERLGHSSISVTMDVYSAFLPDTQEKAADAMDDLLADDG